MSVTWNDSPPTSPPTTDLDPCVAWGAHDHHDHHHAGPPAEDPPAWTTGPPTPPPDRTVRSVAPRRGRGGRVVLVALAATGLVVTGYGARELLEPPTAAVSAAPAPAATSPVVNGSDDEPVAAVAEALGPSVVQIKTSSGLGSGVVYDAAGLILTNAHVVGSEKQVTVKLADGTGLQGDVLGSDAGTDVAVVKVHPAGDLPAARLATTDARVGQLAVAVGSPFGLDESVTAGVISAVNRPVDNKEGVVVAMLQTDAPINPGNSGGALANRRGEVIGINTMIYSQSGENNGIGFAIPVAKAKDVADRITGGGSLDRAWLGVGGGENTTGQPGAVLGQVQDGTPAATAGLATGDRITAVDGTPVKDFGDLAATLGAKRPGDVVHLEVHRGDQVLTVDATLGTRTK